MRVALLQATLGLGGAERLVQSLVGAAGDSALEPVVVNLYGPGPIGEQLIQAGALVKCGLARAPWDPLTGMRLRGTLERERVEVVYVYDSSLPEFWAGWLRRRSARPRLVLGFHSTGYASGAWRHAVAHRMAVPAADRIVALEDSHRDYLCRRFGIARERVSVIPSGVDTRRFSPAADSGAAKRNLGLPAGSAVVGIVAALRPEKNHVLFLEAASRLRKRFPAARFVIVGDGAERPRLERVAAEQALGEAVLFLGARNDIPQVYGAFDLAVLCSRPVVETLPIALLEAAACGVPAVTTDVGSIRDLVLEGKTGCLVPEGDGAALADRIGGLLEDEPLRRRMGRAARERVEGRFTLEGMVAAYRALFLEVGREGAT